MRTFAILVAVAALGCDEPDVTDDVVDQCGDGLLDPGEECDDGNTVDDDACNAACRSNFCGDGIEQQDEECDDGNSDETDGCDSSCRGSVCGNGIEERGEECDDGNTVNDDECSNRCEDNPTPDGGPVDASVEDASVDDAAPDATAGPLDRVECTCIDLEIEIVCEEVKDCGVVPHYDRCTDACKPHGGITNATCTPDADPCP